MPDTFTVENGSIPVDASPEGGKTVHNLHGGTIRYRNTAESVETGEVLEPGDSVTTKQRLWLIADGSYAPATVLVENAEVLGKPYRTTRRAVAEIPNPVIHPSAVDPGNGSAPRRTPHE